MFVNVELPEFSKPHGLVILRNLLQISGTYSFLKSSSMSSPLIGFCYLPICFSCSSAR